MTSNSFLGWIYLDRADMDRAREFVDSWSEEGQRDELGLLPIQGLFADRFYPGTVSQMSIARYLYFLPSIYEWVAARGLSGSTAEERMRTIQEELRKVLRRNGGPRIRENEPRSLPADFYWTSLRELGFFRRQQTEREHLYGLGSVESQEVDDNGEPISVETRNGPWDRARPHSSFLSYEGNVGPKTSPKLTSSEANDLLDRYTRLPIDAEPGDDKPNMLVHLVNLEKASFDHVWEISSQPAHLRKWLSHSRLLSLFARGVRLQYEVMALEQKARLKRAKTTRGAQASRKEVFGDWWKSARKERLQDWDVEEFLGLPGIKGFARRGLPDAYPTTFFGQWLARFSARTRSAADLLSDAEARKAIETRERMCKGLRAKLGGRNDQELRKWNPPKLSRDPHAIDRLYAFDYRHGIGQRFANEILESMKGKKRR
jgi:Family of unknown function (DUF6361)